MRRDYAEKLKNYEKGQSQIMEAPGGNKQPQNNANDGDS